MDFGAFAGGVSSGMNSGFGNLDKLQRIRMDREQLNQLAAQNAGQQAYFNTLIPGGQPMPNPQIGGVDNQSMPAMSQLPIIGDLGRAAGIWPSPPQPPQIGRTGAPVPGGPSPNPQPGFQGGGGAPMPQGPQPGMAVPTGRMQGGQPIESTTAMPMSPMAIAAAVDRANPGLRTSNPRAFAAAVQYGMQQVQQMTQASLGQREAEAKIGQLGAESEMQRAHGQYYEGRSQMQGQANKALTTMYTQNEQEIRNLQSQRTKLATAFDLNKADKKMMLEENQRQLDGLKARRDDLIRQMRGEDVTPTKVSEADKAPVAAVRVSDKNLGRIRALSPEKQAAFFEAMEKDGASKEELAYLARLVKGE